MIQNNAFLLLLSFLLFGASCKKNMPPYQSHLLKERNQFTTKVFMETDTTPPTPPPSNFILCSYPAPLGENAAYITAHPQSTTKYPAIIWLVGGDCNTINKELWQQGTEDNDQTAAVFAAHGIVTMFPSLRGANGNKGKKEAFLGEVDDVLAAFRYLKSLPYIDSTRIYIGGHSTGGTLALLVAACTNECKAVFSFGAVSLVNNYDSSYFPQDVEDEQEIRLRSPIFWINEIVIPTYVIEGKDEPSNVESIAYMEKTINPNIHVRYVEGKDHFSVLYSESLKIAQSIQQNIY